MLNIYTFCADKSSGLYVALAIAGKDSSGRSFATSYTSEAEAIGNLMVKQSVSGDDTEIDTIEHLEFTE
jgi:hypothetical protein